MARGRRTILFAAALAALAAPARAGEPDAAFRAYMTEENFAAQPFKFIERRREEIRKAEEARAKAEAEAEARRRAIFEDYLAAEWAAADPQAVIRAQRRAILDLQARFAAQSAELEAMKSGGGKMREAAAARDKQLEAGREEFRKQNEEQDQKLKQLNEDLEKSVADVRKSLDDRARRQRDALRAQQRAIHSMNERLLRDFESASFDGIEFVRIPAGKFVMGVLPGEEANLREKGFWTPFNEREKPPREVEITRPFLISKAEISQLEWNAVMETENNPSAFVGPDFPVDSVSYNQVRGFIDKLRAATGGKYDLPTEAQWEYCARAGGISAFGSKAKGVPFTYENIEEAAWLAGNSGEKSHPVRQKAPNAWGLYDMTGSLWELCRDWFDPKYYAEGPAVDPVNKTEGIERAMRGGCWALEPQFSRVTARSAILPNARSKYIGFRLVREIDPSNW